MVRVWQPAQRRGRRVGAAKGAKGKGGAKGAQGKGGATAANRHNHRHSECYMFLHESLTTHEIIAADMWISGEPRAKSLAAVLARSG